MAFDVNSLRTFGADRDDDGICRRAADEIERLLDRDKTLREIAQFRIPPSDTACRAMLHIAIQVARLGDEQSPQTEGK
jgi:hypothetical protein